MKKRRNYKSCGQSRTHQLRVGKRVGGLCDRGAKAQAILYRLALLFLCVGGLIPFGSVAEYDFEALVAGSERQAGFVPLTGKLIPAVYTLKLPISKAH